MIGQGKGGGVAGGGGLSQGKGGSGLPATAATLPTNAGGKPALPSGGGNLASMFLGNQGYGGGSGVTLPDVTQPTRPVLGSFAPTLPQRPQPVTPAAPKLPAGFKEGPGETWVAPDGSAYTKEGRQVRLPQMDGNGGMHNNAPVYGAANYHPTVLSFLSSQQQQAVQPAQPSQSALLAAEINRRAAARR